jgi:hypothetical protein
MELKNENTEKLLVTPDVAFSRNKLKKDVGKKMLLKMSNDIDKITTKEECCNDFSNALSTICKILFFSANILSFISAYTNNQIYSIVSGIIGVIGNLCLQYSISSLNEAKSANIKLNQLLANIGVEPVPTSVIPNTDIETGNAPQNEDLASLLKNIQKAAGQTPKNSNPPAVELAPLHT